jgi:hypothetical protein
VKKKNAHSAPVRQITSYFYTEWSRLGRGCGRREKGNINKTMAQAPIFHLHYIITP